jgi:hypothetical protein
MARLQAVAQAQAGGGGVPGQRHSLTPGWLAAHVPACLPACLPACCCSGRACGCPSTSASALPQVFPLLCPQLQEKDKEGPGGTDGKGPSPGGHRHVTAVPLSADSAVAPGAGGADVEMGRVFSTRLPAPGGQQRQWRAQAQAHARPLSALLQSEHCFAAACRAHALLGSPAGIFPYQCPSLPHCLSLSHPPHRTVVQESP